MKMTAADGDFEDRDATRRTVLARERTALAWWRSGITALGVAVAVGRVVPEVSGADSLPYGLLGAGYAIVGLVMVTYGSMTQRARHEETAVVSSRIVLATITIVSIAIGLGTLAVVVAGA
jgi:putative membrane protein